MSNKNPFEVRLDVMKMAQELLDKEFYAKEQKYLHKLEAMKAEKHPDVQSYIDTHAPVAYTSDEVVTRASTLYNFIADSSSATRSK